MALSEAQKRANVKWGNNNRQRKNYIAKRSSAKSFIKVAETKEELRELEYLINERINFLEKNNKNT